MQQTGVIMLFCLFLFSCNSVFSQEVASEYETVWHSADNNSLPQNSVKSIIKDKNGFIWLSTENGLVRYDGKYFLVFDNKSIPQLHSNRMFLFEGSVSKDSIYILNNDHEYVLIKNSKVSFVKKEAIPKGYALDNIISISRGTSIEKIYSNNYYYKIENNLITCYNLKNKTLWQIYFNNSNAKFFIFNERLYSYDNKGNYNLFFKGKAEKVSIEGLSKGKIDIFINPVAKQVFFKDNKNLYLLSCIGDKLVLYPVLLDFDLSKDNIITAFFENKSQILYLGSGTKGLLTAKKKDFKVINGHKGKGVYYAQFPFDDSSILTSTGEVFSLSGVSKKINVTRDDDGYNLMINKKGDVWIKFENFVFCYFKKTNYASFKKWKFNNRVTQIFENSDGRIFVGTENVNKTGILYSLDTIKKENFRFFMLFDFVPELIVQDNPNMLWITSVLGLHRVDIQNKKVKNIESFRNKHVMSLYIEDKNKIWAVAHEEGIFLYNPIDRKTTHFPLDKKKILYSAHCIIKDDNGFFWISTNRGLLQVSRQNLLNYSLGKTDGVYYYYYDKTNGLLTNEFNGGCQPCGVYLNNKFITFPSMQGNVFFNSNKIKPLEPNSKIFFEEAEINNVKYPQNNDTLNLNSDFTRLRLFIRSPYYGNPNNFNIDVKLEGPISQDWISLDQDNIEFTALPHGEYKVRARKLSGFDSKYIYASKVLIVPKKFWQTTLFKIVLSIITILICYYLFGMRVKYLKKKNIALEKKVSERTEQLSETIAKLKKTKIKLNIEVENHKKLIGTITHDIKSPLRFLALTGKQAYQKIQKLNIIDKKDDPESLDEAIKVIYTSSFQLYNFVDNLLQYTKISTKEISPELYSLHILVAEKIRMFANIAESKKLEIKNTVDENLVIYANRLLLSIIIHNLLDNAIKNTFEGGILFSVIASSGKIELMISDSGRGMTGEALQFYSELFKKKQENRENEKIGMGFQMISELLTLLEGKIEINSEVGSGTQIKIRFPNTLAPNFDKY